MTMTLTKINRNSVSLAGEFAALSQLALRGYDANMTLVGRTKSVDILVSNPATLPSVAMAARNRARRIPHHIARNDGNRVRLYSRPGNDLTHRFPLIVDALSRLRSRSCIIDGEAVTCDDNGVASFNLIRYRRHDDSTFLYAFDLIELNGDDLRHDPLEVRKAALASIVAKASSGIRFNEHLEGDGPTVFAHACKLGLEGIVSKRKDSTYRSGRSPDWLKMKNSDAPAVKREAEEDWGKKKWR
jgi:bifunctional non-homologous end joining protein LigD